MICPRSHSWSLAGQPLNPELSGSKTTNCLASLKPPWSIITRTPGGQERRNPDLLNHLRTKQIHGLNVLRTNFKTAPFSQCNLLIYLLKEFVCVCVCAHTRTFSHVQLFVTPWTVACQDSLSMGFPKQEYWSELPIPSPGDLKEFGST